MLKIKTNIKHIDYSLVLVVVLLTFFGIVMVYEASSFVAFRDFADKYYYLKEQLKWVILGISSLIFFSFFDYHKFYNMALPLLIIAFILLILVFIPGLGVYALGAYRWVNFKLFVLQPAEFVKLALAIYLSAWLSNKEKGRIFSYILLVGALIFLVMLEPDMGTASIILFEALSIYFISGESILAFSILAPIVALVGYILIKIEPYRAERLAAFLNFSESLEKNSYHVKQILIALGMGGITGVGLGNSLQKYAYLPENTTDSIFAIIAEELGFIGASVLITLFLIVIWRGLIISSLSKDKFGKLLAAGITCFLAMQMIINLGAQTALIPLTGVPLPFISYGGSALVVDLCAIGILLNISKQNYS